MWPLSQLLETQSPVAVTQSSGFCRVFGKQNLLSGPHGSAFLSINVIHQFAQFPLIKPHLEPQET